MCHMSCVLGHLLPVTCHLSPTRTTTAIDPPPNSYSKLENLAWSQTRVAWTMALIGRPNTTRTPAHMDDPQSEPNLHRPGSIFGSTFRIVSNVQILQRFLGFYVLELCDWALRWIAKDKTYNFSKYFSFWNVVWPWPVFYSQIAPDLGQTAGMPDQGLRW